MRPLFLLLSVTPLWAAGCDADCGNPARLDGSYRVHENTTSVDGWTVTGFDEDQTDEQTTLLYGVFANGLSTWDLKYVPADKGFRVTVDGQQYDASYTPAQDNCNRFDLAFEGLWTNPENGATHQFTWDGQLVWTGDELGGSFVYEDAWGLDGSTGTVTIPDGEIRATLKAGAAASSDDTGG